MTTEKKYWLKPIGVTGGRIPKDLKYDYTPEVHFAIQPQKVQIGDLLITYAVGYRKIIAVLEVVSIKYKAEGQELAESPEWRERFPWAVTTRNLTKTFSDQWYAKGLNIFDLGRAFVAQFNQPITNTGRKDLNAMQRGWTVYELSPDFGRWCIQQVENKNKA